MSLKKIIWTVAGTIRNALGGDSIVEIEPGLFIGNKFDARSARDMKKYGIDAVLNVAHEVYDPPLPKEFIQAKYGLVDGVDEHNATVLDYAIRTLNRWRTQGRTVLVHCYLGQNRAPYVVSNYLARKNGTAWRDEFAAIQLVRPEAYIKEWMK